MDVHAAIETRRSYRSLAPFPVDEALIRDLARHAQLAPSCSNNQPWRYVFVYDPAALAAMRPVFSPANGWCHAASMIIAVFSRREDDCLRDGRDFHQFDTGLATAFLILRATELGLVAHPIAGFDAAKARDILGIPDIYQVITLVLVGKHATGINPALTPQQAAIEGERPERYPQEKFVFLNRFSG